MSSRQAKTSHGLPPGQKRLSFDVGPGSKRSKLADSSSALGAPRPPPTRLQHRDASGSSFAQCPICAKQVPLLCINLHLDGRCGDLGPTRVGRAAVGGPGSGARSRPPGSAGRGMEPASLWATGQGRPDGEAVGEAASFTEPRREDAHQHQLPSQQPQKQFKQPAKQQQETRSRQQQAQQQGQPNQLRQQQQEEEDQKQRAAAATLRSSASASHAELFLPTVSACAASTAAPADRAGGGVSDDDGETARQGAAGGCASLSRSFHAAMSPPPRPSSSTIDVFDVSRDIAGGGENGGIAAGGGGGGGDSVGGDVGSHSAQARGLGLAGPAPLHPMFLAPTRSAPGPRMKGDGHAWQEHAGRPATEAASAADGSAGGDGVQDLADAGGCRASRDRQGRRMQASATPHATAAVAAAREDNEGAGGGSFGCGNADGGGGGGAPTGASMVEMGLSVFQPVPHPSLDGQYVVLEFVTPAEEAKLLALCDDPVLRPPWSPWSGTTYANATAQRTRGKRWGVLPDYHRRGVAPLEHPLPPLLRLLEERMRARVGLLRSFRPNEANAIDYRRSRGSWLRPHVDDRILSGDLIVNLCLAGAAVMSFGRDKPTLGRQQHPQHREQHREQRPPSEGDVRVLLPPRSLQILSRAARYNYTHAIAPGDLLDERRVSITFRRSEPRPFEKPAQ